MVQKFQSPVRVYKYPFELVMKAYECRFPTCPQMPIVLDCELIADELLENGAKRHSSRRCKLAVEAPYIFKKLIGVEVVYFLQHNYLDLANRTLNIEAINESFSSRIEVFERCRYYAHPDNPDWTCFDQTATLDVKNFFGFEHSMEKMGMKQYTQTTLKGREIIEYFINELKAKGITQVDRWQPPSDALDACRAQDTRDLKMRRDSVESNVERRKSSQSKIMLDGDFIAKHLGQLSPMQESKLLELRKMIADVAEDARSMPTYQTIVRFLNARDWHVDKAFTMLRDSLKWRRDNHIDGLLRDYRRPSVVVNHFPGGWHHHDKDGRPIYILRLGHMDVKGLLKALGTDELLKLSLYICEEGIQRINESAACLGRPVLSWCLLVDLEGLSMRHLWRPGVKALYNIIETVERNYPETMGRVLVVRAPRVFPIAWTIVSTFIDENTRSKFLFFAGSDIVHMRDGLEQYIEAASIPDFLGGTCKSLLHEGGLVPKSLYKMNSLEEEDGQQARGDNDGAPTSNEHQNLYKSVELRTGYVHEMVVHNTDPKSVLTWDFEVKNSELHFTLYRTSKELSEKNDEMSSFLDISGFVEGENYFREEATIICRDKESVQGSYVMDHIGSYIMHWFSPTTGAKGRPTQLNYFYEVLSSANYKGSMTSLQSGFSAMSVASSCQSR